MPATSVAAPAGCTVSVLVTVWNRAHILRETVASIQQSTFRDFEVVLVDDCSTDESWQVCERLACEDAAVRACRNAVNLGDYANRNRAAALAQGRYLKYLDADDLIYSHGLQVMVAALEDFPEAALALSANVIDPEVPYPQLLTPSDFFHRHFLGRSPLGVGPSAAIIRRECFEAVGGFSGRQFVGDTELWLKLAESWPIVLLPPALVWWRRHAGQQMSLEISRPEVLNIRFRLALETLAATRHLGPAEKIKAETRLRRNHARTLMSWGIRNRHPVRMQRLLGEAGLQTKDVLLGLMGYI